MKKLSTIILLVFINFVTAKRGPHHPRGEFIVKRDTQNKKEEFIEHLTHDDEHIQEDLTGMHVHHKNVNEMTDDERSFYYFKVHDSDNNNYLDGLEMIKAAIHRHDNFDYQDEFKHIESVVDEFLDFADLNRDGFLNYAEYMKAMNASNEEKDSQPPLKSVAANNHIEQNSLEEN